jgi:hypothetical protein
MPFISITRLRIRAIRDLPRFAWLTLQSHWQVRCAAGFRGGALLADRHRTFWTVTAWDDRESMHRFMTTGPHRRAMPHLLDWCDEASIVHWDQAHTSLPSWAEADRRMRRDGRPAKVRHPGPDHAALGFPAPRRAAAVTIRPAGRAGR